MISIVYGRYIRAYHNTADFVSPMHFPPQDAPFPPPIVRLVRPKNDQKRQDRRQRSPRRGVQRKLRVQHPLVVQRHHKHRPTHDQGHLCDGVRGGLPEVGEEVVTLPRAADALHSQRVVGVQEDISEPAPLAGRP